MVKFTVDVELPDIFDKEDIEAIRSDTWSVVSKEIKALYDSKIGERLIKSVVLARVLTNFEGIELESLISLTRDKLEPHVDFADSDSSVSEMIDDLQSDKAIEKVRGRMGRRSVLPNERTRQELGSMSTGEGTPFADAMTILDFLSTCSRIAFDNSFIPPDLNMLRKEAEEAHEKHGKETEATMAGTMYLLLVKSFLDHISTPTVKIV